MRTTIITSLALGMALALGSTLPALGQGAPQVEVPIACIIGYADIGITGPGIPDEELVLDGPNQTAVANLIGTPPNERIRLVCTDLVQPQTGPIRMRRFPCQVFRGRRGGQETFQITTDTDISIDNQGRVTMTCTAN